MTFGDDMKRKADEVHLQNKAKDLGDAVADLVKAALGMVGSFAAENREKVDGALDKAQETVGGNLTGRSADKVTKVRAQVDKGLDKLVDQRDLTGTSGNGGTTGTAPGAAGAAGTATPQPQDRAWPDTPVPDDVHSAFDEEDSVPDVHDGAAGRADDSASGSPS